MTAEKNQTPKLNYIKLKMTAESQVYEIAFVKTFDVEVAMNLITIPIQKQTQTD